MSKSRAAVLALVAAAVVAFFLADGHRMLSLEQLHQSAGQLRSFVETRPLEAVTLFFLMYVAVTALSLPGAAVMTIAAGALFGIGWGVLLVSFASTIGATLAFAAARWLLRDAARRRLGDRLESVDRGVARDGAFYLFSLRLVPVIPFFLINLAMALTPLRTWTFYWVSQVGMLPGTIVYVNAGTQLAQLDGLGGLLSADVIVAFLLLAAFPWISRGILKVARPRRALRGWQRPKHFDHNVVVIGAGSAGLVSAYAAAAGKARVALVEQRRMGGDCLNTGCVPSKALIKSARLAHQTRHLARYGIDASEPRIDFAAVMNRVHGAIAQIEPHDSIERYESLGVDCHVGHARLVSPWEVEITSQGRTRTLTSRSIIIATGARPAIPALPGLDQIDYLTSENLWELRRLPPRLLVLGGGPIGCELSQAFARLGSRVTQIDRGDRLLSRDEPEASRRVLQSLEDDGVEVLLETTAARFAIEAGERVAYAERGDQQLRLPFDEVLIALGRQANTEGLGLESLGVALRSDGTIQTDEHLQTTVPGVYACGDVTGPFQFTHTASHQAGYAAVNALLGGAWRFKVDYSTIPWTTFTDPEVGHVGLTEQQARNKGIDYEVTRYSLQDLDRAIADGAASGFVQVITAKGRDRILGATVVGSEAGHMLAELVVAMANGIGLKRLHRAVHVYPTLSEAIRNTAGEWRKAHAPVRLLDWLARIHHWRLGTPPRASRSAPASRAEPS